MMWSETHVLDLAAVVDLIEVTVDDNAHRPAPAADPVGRTGPALWWIRDGAAAFLTGNGTRIVAPVPALGSSPRAGNDRVSGAVPCRVIGLTDTFVVEVLAAADAGARHLLILDSPPDFHLATTTLPYPPPGNARTGQDRRFAVHPGAREWLTGVVVDRELNEPCGPHSPPVDLAWNPRLPGNEDSVEELTDAAQTLGVLTRPPGSRLRFLVTDDGDDGEFRYLLTLPTPSGNDLTLASPGTPLEHLGGTAIGIEAALHVLHDAAATGNALLDHLIAHTSPPPSPRD